MSQTKMVQNADVEVREVSSIEEYDGCIRLQREAFGLPDLEISPRRHLIVSRMAGGWTLGAFIEGKLVGFVHHMAAAYGDQIFGYSHMMGGYAGGQAQYVRVPFADVGPIKIPNHLDDEKVLFLSDIFPTGYMAAENCNIHSGDVIAIWGCGPVGQFAIRSAYMLGAEKVIAIDFVAERLEMADQGKAQIINHSKVDDLVEVLKQMTGGRGPDACIDAVGMEAHGKGLPGLYDQAKWKLGLSFDRPTVLRQAIQACRKGGTVSLPGVYGGFVDKIPFGAAFGKGLTFRMGQTHVHSYLQPLLGRIERGEIDPSFVITHRISLDDVPDMYRMFRDKEQGCIKVVIDPWKYGQASLLAA